MFISKMWLRPRVASRRSVFRPALVQKIKRHAAGAVAGKLAAAAVGVVELDGGIGFARLRNQDPAIGADPGVAVANRYGQSGAIGAGGDLFAPRDQKIVAVAVGFGERNFHGRW